MSEINRVSSSPVRWTGGRAGGHAGTWVEEGRRSRGRARGRADEWAGAGNAVLPGSLY